MCELLLYFSLKLATAPAGNTHPTAVCGWQTSKENINDNPMLVLHETILSNMSCFWFFLALTSRAESPFAINIKENEQRWKLFGSLPSSPSKNTSGSKIFHVKDVRVDSRNILFQKFPSEKAALSVHPSICPSITPQSVHSQINTEWNSVTSALCL